MAWLRRLCSRRRRYHDLSLSIEDDLRENIEELMEEGRSREDAI